MCNEYNSKNEVYEHRISEAGCIYVRGVDNRKCAINAHTVNAQLVRIVMSIIVTLLLKDSWCH